MISQQRINELKRYNDPQKFFDAVLCEMSIVRQHREVFEIKVREFGDKCLEYKTVRNKKINWKTVKEAVKDARKRKDIKVICTTPNKPPKNKWKRIDTQVEMDGLSFPWHFWVPTDFPDNPINWFNIYNTSHYHEIGKLVEEMYGLNNASCLPEEMLLRDYVAITCLFNKGAEERGEIPILPEILSGIDIQQEYKINIYNHLWPKVKAAFIRALEAVNIDLTNIKENNKKNKSESVKSTEVYETGNYLPVQGPRYIPPPTGQREAWQKTTKNSEGLKSKLLNLVLYTDKLAFNAAKRHLDDIQKEDVKVSFKREADKVKDEIAGIIASLPDEECRWYQNIREFVFAHLQTSLMHNWEGFFDYLTRDEIRFLYGEIVNFAERIRVLETSQRPQDIETDLASTKAAEIEQKESPLLLPSCKNIKNYLVQIKTPKELGDFLENKYKPIYDSCNFDKESSFFDIIREAAIKMRRKHLSLPQVPTTDNIVDYQNWCINAEIRWRKLKDREQNSQKKLSKRATTHNGFMNLEQLCKQFNVPDKNKQAFRKRLERFRAKNTFGDDTFIESQNKGARQAKYLYNVKMVASIAEEVKGRVASFKRPSKKKTEKN